MGIRYSLILDKEIDKKINTTAKRRKITKANAIRNAVIVLSALEEETYGKNKKVAIVDDEDRVEKIILLPH